jgi:hypothetical protein
MRCWRRMKISWTDRVRNEEVLHGVKEETIILHTKKKGTSCLGTPFFKLFIEDYNLQYVQYTMKKLQNFSDHQFN